MTEFYDIHEQTKYEITISKPINMEDLSDLFITEDELKELTGQNYFYSRDNDKRTIVLKNVVRAAVKKWSEKLDASKAKTLPIEDEELLVILKKNYLSDFAEENRFGRHGDRICYTTRYKRKKTKATRGDVRDLWGAFSYGFFTKYKTYPSHIPTYDRHLKMFKAFQKIVGWRRVRATTTDKEQAKFFRQIWDKPEEYMK